MKLLCLFRHRYTHVVQEWRGVIMMEIVSCGTEHLLRVCGRCGHAQEFHNIPRRTPVVLTDMPTRDKP